MKTYTVYAAGKQIYAGTLEDCQAVANAHNARPWAEGVAKVMYLGD